MASRNRGHQLSEIGWRENLHTTVEAASNDTQFGEIDELQSSKLACLYLSCKDATEADNDQDIKDG